MATDDGGSSRGELNPFAAPEITEPVPVLAPVVETVGFRSTTPLASALTVTLVLMAIVCAASAASEHSAIAVMERVQVGATVPQEELKAIDARASIVALAQGALHLGAIVLFCFFMPRANRNARAFGSGPLTFTPRWAAGVFFTPLWSLYKPYRAMKEIWQGSDPDPTTAPMMLRLPGLFGWWWALFLISNGAQQVVYRMAKEVKTPATYILKAHAEIVAEVLTIISAFLAIMVVREVARRQDERQRRFPAGTPLPVPRV